MPWLKLTDDFTDHRKLMALGDDAAPGIALFVTSALYSSRALTEGFVPTLAAKHSIGWDERIAARLVEVGLWDAVEGGYQIHDFLDYNPTKKTVEKHRKARSKVKSEAGKANSATANRMGGRFAPKPPTLPEVVR